MLDDSDLLDISSRTGLDNAATHLVKRPALLVADGADNTPRSWPGDRFHHLFEARLEGGKHVADALAVEFEEETHSFKDLIVLANRIGRYLQDQGASAGDVIALLFDRSIHAYASILAVSKIGCTFVPLDAGFPDNRIEIICKDSKARFALTVSFHSARFANCELSVIALDGAEEEYGKLSATAPVLEGSDVDDPILYIIYTSGTTGKPKGVPIRHSSICNFLRVAAETYGFKKSDRVYQALTLAFDYSFEEIWVPLLCGACLVPAPQGVNLLGDDLAQYLIDRRISAWCSVPTILTTIDCDLPDLRLLIVSGEACSPDLLMRWWAPHRRFLNVYGPTETTVSATWKVLQSDEPVTIGVPLPTYTSMILSAEKDELLAIGETGELALAGVGLADGYLNREAETSKAFITDFLNIEHNPSGRIYRTGDLARINQNGEIDYLGRVDTQVKIRGYRIELGEIESVARTLAGVASLVVNPVEVEAGNVELALYYVAKEEDAVDVSTLHDTLRDQLPAYMVPAYFERLEALPLLASLKLDRKKLPLPSGARLLDSGREFVEPAEGIEADLAGVLAGALKIERVSADADFFDDLGANSLVMARYLGNVRKKLGIKTSMKAIYQHPTIQLLATAVAPREEVVVAPAMADTVSVGTLEAETARLDSEVMRHPETPSTQPSLQSASNMIGLAVADNGQGNVGEKSGSNSFEPHRVSTVQYVAVAVAQLAWMTFVAFVIASAGLALFNWLLLAKGFWQTFGRASVASVAMFGGISAFLIAVKWIAVGRFKPGVIPVWTPDYLRFWIAQTAIRANPMILFVGTPAYNVFLRLLGAKVGKGTIIFSPPPVATDLISIGSDTVIRQLSIFHGYTARNGRLYLGTVKIGSRSYLGEATVMDIDSELGDDAQLGNRSALHEGQKGEGGKIHLGSPAIVGSTDFIRVPVEEVSPARAWLYTAGQFMATILIGGPAVTALLLVGTQMFYQSQNSVTGQAAASTGILVPFGISLLTYFGVILGGILLVSVMPKVWNYLFRANEIHKLFGFQYFLARRIFASSNNAFLQALFGDSSLIVPYFKAVGYDLKNLTQNGSNFGVQQNHHSPFLCTFNANTLVSDGLFMINMDLSRSSFKMSNISVPKDVYLGNDLHYPPGARIGENCLIATKAMIPIDGEMRVNVGVLGSPSFEIPRSKERDGRLEHYKQEGVFEQRLGLKLKSNLGTLGLFMFRNWSMLFIATVAGFWLYDTFAITMSTTSLTGGALLAVFATMMLLFRSFYYILYERLANWYRPMKPRICSLYERPFWDHERFWKLNIDPVRDIVFAGTPVKNLISRCQGVNLGKQVFDDGFSCTEPQLVTVGDYCTLNFGSIAQSHSLEDGTFKCDAIRIGERCTLGVAGFVHYGADIGNDVDIRTDAFVMKGSMIPDGETWTGNPAAQISSSQEFGVIHATGSAIDQHNNSMAGVKQ